MGKGHAFLAGLGAMLAMASAAHAGNCSNPTGVEGTITYNRDYKTMQFCNGTNWVAMGGVWNVPWQASGTAVYYNGGNVGIGTASPGAKVEVAGTVSTTALNIQGVATPRMTFCSYAWGSNATGWRTHVWVDGDCTNGLPLAGSVGFGQSTNGSGGGGMANCSSATQGSQYNHPTYDGATSAAVYCLYLKW